MKRPCDKPELHTEQPELYSDWQSWAIKMSKTHYQEQCPSCGLWAVWVPKDSVA